MWQRSLWQAPGRVLVLLSVVALVACGPSGATTPPTAAPAKPAAQAPTAAPKTEAKPTAAPAAPKTEAKPAEAAKPTAAPAAAAKPAAKQSITIAIGLVPRNFDPKNTTAVADYNYLRLVYDTLVTADSGKPEPWAAESWQAIDATHWRFVIRPGITFSNGEPFDANAVKYTLDRALEDPKTPWRERVANIKEVRVIDARTVDFMLDAPVGNLPTRLSVVWIVPPKHTEAQGLATTPVGSGPFTVSSYTPAQSLTLQARKDYWKGAPKLETVQFRPVPEASTRVSSLLAGDVDVAHLILPEQVDQVKSRNYEVISEPTGQSANIFFQTSRDTPIANVKVRQAIDFAIDKQAIFQGMTLGLGRFLDGQIVGPNSVGYDPSIKARPYDPARAKQLLAEAGYPNGFEVDFDLAPGRYFRVKETVEAVAGYLQAVGIRVKLNPMEGGAWLDRLYSGTSGPMNYWSIQDAPAYDLSWTMEIFKPGNTRKLTADQKLDEMINRSFEITDTAQRNAYLQEFARYLFEQTYFVTFHQDPGLYGVNPKVKGISFTPSMYINLLEAYVAE